MRWNTLPPIWHPKVFCKYRSQSPSYKYFSKVLSNKKNISRDKMRKMPRCDSGGEWDALRDAKGCLPIAFSETRPCRALELIKIHKTWPQFIRALLEERCAYLIFTLNTWSLYRGPILWLMFMVLLLPALAHLAELIWLATLCLNRLNTSQNPIIER